MSYLGRHPYRMIVHVSHAVKCDTRGMIERMTSTRIVELTVELSNFKPSAYLSRDLNFPECHTSCTFCLSREPFAH